MYEIIGDGEYPGVVTFDWVIDSHRVSVFVDVNPFYGVEFVWICTALHMWQPNSEDIITNLEEYTDAIKRAVQQDLQAEIGRCYQDCTPEERAVLTRAVEILLNHDATDQEASTT